MEAEYAGCEAITTTLNRRTTCSTEHWLKAQGHGYGHATTKAQPQLSNRDDTLAIPSSTIRTHSRRDQLVNKTWTLYL